MYTIFETGAAVHFLRYPPPVVSRLVYCGPQLGIELSTFEEETTFDDWAYIGVPGNLFDGAYCTTGGPFTEPTPATTHLKPSSLG